MLCGYSERGVFLEFKNMWLDQLNINYYVKVVGFICGD